MDINEGYRFVQFLANQTQSGGIKPIDFNLASERAQIQLFYTERQKWQDTQIITDALSPFLIEVPLNVPTNGRVVYPSDYAGTSSVRHTYFLKSSTASNPKAIYVDVDEMNEHHLRNALKKMLRDESLKNSSELSKSNDIPSKYDTENKDLKNFLR